MESLKEVALEKDSIVNCDETWCKVRKYDCYKKCYIYLDTFWNNIFAYTKDGGYPIDTMLPSVQSILSQHREIQCFIWAVMKERRWLPLTTASLVL
ncbi:MULTISPECIES: hypothetical protein [Bacteroides]|uniref:hypothetical protein n=1 Tax=Bacteroides sp. L10-4 TaxID=2746063 RepID=UPI001595AB13|nr:MULTISPECIES: hypothetical protein [Bacteroides]MCM1955740.1 hypothetical protein [Bacteroides uniformis]NVK94737.1 hypothetical protein [Bacteroides sp. L10-4]